ncbi:TerD family protein [Bacillus altitudinis]|uniref:TerD family protein n=1 Tax=Bacillus altitudinis TaxID=293387 RepID=UPI002EC542CA|nr:TerD family protein [Bacillus altitudinis]MEE3611699.1 TerD family protein [Bacillus altitudinis]MEE3646931.1 TerD family protein [Bacillus altitudinis]MEE4391354.1 TerD family protein [Bacillus altitudinis]MEE4395449.1 TerD family protein [Bacillus altitudinis]
MSITNGSKQENNKAWPMRQHEKEDASLEAVKKHLMKGQKLDLTKDNPNVDQLHIGLGWDLSGQPIDLDTQVFLLNEEDKLLSPKHLIYYHQQQSLDGAVRHLGDHQVGGGHRDNEIIIMQLSRVSPDIQKIVVTATIHDAHERTHHFGQVTNAYLRLSDQITQQEICTFQLTEDYSFCTSIICAELTRVENEWKITATGQGTTLDLNDLCRIYGFTS